VLAVLFALAVVVCIVFVLWLGTFILGLGMISCFVSEYLVADSCWIVVRTNNFGRGLAKLVTSMKEKLW
jgi:hypothetical protein